MGSGYDDNGLVFCLPDGRPFNPDRFSREFDRRLKRHDLPPNPPPRPPAHMGNAGLGSRGVDVKVVAERLGHSSPTVTWQTYQHVTPAMQSGAAEKVAGLIFGAPS